MNAVSYHIIERIILQQKFSKTKLIKNHYNSCLKIRMVILIWWNKDRKFMNLDNF